MRKLLLLLGLLLPSQAAAQPPVDIVCSRTTTISAGATALTQIVAARTGFQKAICGYEINAGAAAGTFQLSYGTGANCGTGTVNLTPTFSLAINGVLVSRGGGAMTVPVSNALCYTITGTGPINVVIYFTEF